ncbi:MAG: hypothetical protein P1P78_15765, partial [Methyloprofundus sp.]|nr:hypothetical protein [Methyloprofundus sp.]
QGCLCPRCQFLGCLNNYLLSAKNAQENQGRFILFLARNPDNETYGFYSLAHKVRLDNRGAKYFFEDKEYDVLDGSINPDNFVKAVKEKSVK